MERVLPLVHVGKHLYRVDFRNGELREDENKGNTIPFYKMDRNAEGFSFFYDEKTKKLVSGKIHDHSSTTAELVKLPIAVKLDPAFFEQLTNEELTVMGLIRNSKSIYSVPGRTHSPMEIKGPGPRLLPIVNVYGTDFFLDLRLQEFRQCENAFNRIPLSALQPEEFHFTLWYDSTAKNEFKGTESELGKREDVKYLVLQPLDIMVSKGIELHKTRLTGKEGNKNGFTRGQRRGHH